MASEAEKKKHVRFISVSPELGWHDSFMIEDGGTIIIDGKEIEVKYIDDCHLDIGSCYHIEEFFNKFVKQNGSIVLPGKGLKTKMYSELYEPYNLGNYELVSFADLGEDVFEWSNSRIIRETLPLGIYAYDVRYCEERMDACQISDFVYVNYLATILSRRPLYDRKRTGIYLEHGYYYRDELLKSRIGA